MRARYVLWGLILLVVAARVTSPVDFEGDQARQVGYVMDILHGGDLSLQYEVNGEVATKPPLYNWIAAAFCEIFGTTAPWVMKLPSLIAAIGLLFVLHRLARKWFDDDVAFWTIVACISAHHFVKLTWYARTDMLMVLCTYAAILATVSRIGSWPKALVIGALLGVNILIKGPVGPALYAAWLAMWTWHEGLWRRKEVYAPSAVAALIALVIGGVWLAIVWNKPQFQEGVLGIELGNKLRGEAPQGRPMHYYLREMLGRTAPWPLVALAAVWFARGKNEWRLARFCAIWWFVFLLLFTLMPDKRADRMLPIYPPMFMLAGVGMKYVMQREWRGWTWLGYALAAVLVVLPGVLVIRRGAESSAFAWALLIVTLACGVLAALLTKRRNLHAAVLWILAGIVAVNGLYDHGFGNRHDTDAYARVRTFARSIEAQTAPGKVLVWQSDPLVSYELGLYQRGVDLASMGPGAYDWVVTTEAGAGEVAAQTHWRLEKAATSLVASKYRGETFLFKRSS